MKRSLLVFFCALLLLAAAGCAPGPKITKLTGVWNDKDARHGYIEKLMIVGMAKAGNNATRILYEKHIARMLERRKVEVVASNAVIPDLKDLNTLSILKAAQEARVDAVLMAKVVGIDEQKVLFKQTQQDNFILTPYGGHIRTYTFDDPRTETVKKVRLESSLYDQKSEKLIWAATSSIIGPDSVNEAIDDFSRAMVEQLTKDGYVRPGLIP